MTISIDTNRSNPVASDDRGLGRRIKQQRNRLRAKRRVLEVRNRHTDLDDMTDWLLADYVQAVKGGEDRHHLSAILTGISGALLAQSACWYTQGYAAEFVVWGCLAARGDAVIENGVMARTWPGPEVLADLSDAQFAVLNPAGSLA